MELQDDMMVMQNGRVMLMKDGKLVPLMEGVTTTDGSRVMPDGTVTMANGTTRMLQEGETMTLSGEVPEMNEGRDQE